MATQTTVRLVDDLDGSDAVRTVTFSLDGKDYEIDLSDENLTKLFLAVDEFVVAARKAGPARTKRTTSTTRTTSSETAKAREWLRANDHEVSDRGRLSQEQWDLYNQRNVGADVVEEGPVNEPEEETTEEAPELDTSDDAVMAWHKVKGYKVPKSGKIGSLHRDRYLKAHGAA